MLPTQRCGVLLSRVGMPGELAPGEVRSIAMKTKQVKGCSLQGEMWLRRPPGGAAGLRPRGRGPGCRRQAREQQGGGPRDWKQRPGFHDLLGWRSSRCCGYCITLAPQGSPCLGLCLSFFRFVLFCFCLPNQILGLFGRCSMNVQS